MQRPCLYELRDADFLPASVRGPVDLRALFRLIRARLAGDRRFFIGASLARRSSSRAADAAPTWISSWDAAESISRRCGEAGKPVPVVVMIRTVGVIRGCRPSID